MNISQEGLSLIKKFEGCELKAYKCAAGVWTKGYGSTKGVKEGDTLTQEEADELLLHEMEEYEGYINNAVTVDNYIMGDFRELAIASWGGIEISKNDFYDDRRFISSLNAIMSFDSGLLEPKAMCKITKA